MNTKNTSLEQIRVAKPCTANWEEMTGNDSVRFCSQCQLNVYNLSALTKTEAEKLINQAEGRLCAKFYQRTDGTVLTQDCPVGLLAVRKRVSKIAATTFSTLLGLLTGNSLDRVTFAQDSKLDQSKPTIKRMDLPFTSSSIEGRVFDASQGMIARAQVTLVNQKTKFELVTRTSETGKFKFQGVTPGEYTVQVSSPGFKSFTMTNINIASNELIDIGLKLEVGGEIMGIIVTTETLETSNHTLPTQINRKEKPRE
ncbi:MAG: carboxypeptidase-like regulatory domain-containing protein [Acidobacteriota bacterium]